MKTELRAGAAANNPYLAFRRRTEKMQTRKNRKNDETSYEKMLKLRRDLSRAVTLLEMVKRREKTKRELLHLTIEVYEKRCVSRLFASSSHLLASLSREMRLNFAQFVSAKSSRKLYNACQVPSGRLQWTVVGRGFGPQELPTSSPSICSNLPKSIQHQPLDQQGSNQGDLDELLWCIDAGSVS